MVGGTIESPILDCDDSEDGGIIGIAVEIEESTNNPFFNCTEETDTYGDYECPVSYTHLDVYKRQ